MRSATERPVDWFEATSALPGILMAVQALTSTDMPVPFGRPTPHHPPDRRGTEHTRSSGERPAVGVDPTSGSPATGQASPTPPRPPDASPGLVTQRVYWLAHVYGHPVGQPVDQQQRRSPGRGEGADGGVGVGP